METGLVRIAEIARRRPKERFTALVHHINAETLMECHGELRIADRNVLRIIKRFLRAGVMEGGVIYDTPSGTPQGGVISPILANVYLHYVLDLWFEKVVRRQCAGEKTRIIAFGRYAESTCRKEGRRKPETFDFLGFTHYCSRGQKGYFRVKRKASKKKYRSGLLRCKIWLRKHLN